MELVNEEQNKILAELDLPLVSVVMPWGGGSIGFFNDAVASILAQTYRKFELLIVTHDLSLFRKKGVNKKQLKDPRIRFVLAEGLTPAQMKDKRQRAEIGFPLILNTGIRAAKGQIIARHDADDKSKPDRFEKQVDFLRVNDNYDAVGTGMEVIDESDKTQYLHIPLTNYDEMVNFMAFKDNTFVHGSIMARAEVLKQNPYYYDPFGCSVEDYDLWCRILFQKGALMGNLPEPLYQYRTNPEGIIRQMGERLNAKRKWVQDRWRYYKNMTNVNRQILRKKKILHYLVTMAIGGAEVHTANMLTRATYRYDYLVNNVLEGLFGGEILEQQISHYYDKKHYTTWERGQRLIQDYDVLVMSYLGGGQESLLRNVMSLPKDQRPTVILVNYVTRDLQFPNPEGANVDSFIKMFCGDPPAPICDYMLVPPESVWDWQDLFPMTTIIPYKIGARFTPDPEKVKALESRFKKDGKKTIMMVGRCGIEKGHLEIVPIVKDLKSIMDEPFQVLILGRYQQQDWNKLKDSMKEHGVTDDELVVIGQVKPDEVSDYLALADVFVHTSPVETYPVALIEEAMANKAIVTKYNPDAERNREKYALNVEHVKMIADPYLTTYHCATQLKELLASGAGNKGYDWIMSNNDFEDCLRDLDQKIVTCILKGHKGE